MFVNIFKSYQVIARLFVFLFLVFGFVFVCNGQLVFAKTVKELETEMLDANREVASIESELETVENDCDALEKEASKIVREQYLASSSDTNNVCVAILNGDFQQLGSLFVYNQKVCDEVKTKLDTLEKMKNDINEKIKVAKDKKVKAEKAFEEKKKQEEAKAKWDEIHFAQASNPWGTLPYWGGTVGNSGCGLCAYTVMVDMLKGQKYTPSDMLSMRGDWRGEEEFPESRTGTLDNTTHAEWTKQKFDIVVRDDNDKSINHMKEYLSDGEGVLMLCSNGSNIFKNNQGATRSSDGHYIIVYKYDENTKQFYVQDSSWGDNTLGKKVSYSESEMEFLLSHTQEMTSYHN